MSTDQLLAALTTAGASVAGFARTFGRIRSAEAVGELAAAQNSDAAELETTSTDVGQRWTYVTALQTKGAVMEARTAGLPAL